LIATDGSHVSNPEANGEESNLDVHVFNALIQGPDDR
jgi:hypothetical protein